MIPVTWMLEVAFSCDMTPTFAEEESVAEVDAEDTGCRCQQMLVSLSDEDLAFMDSPSFPSVETHSSKDTQDGRHRAGPRRNHKIEKVIAQLRTKRVHARSELIEFLAINGFNVRDVNCKKRTRWELGYTYPLHMAAAQDRPRIVSLLLQCGADAMAKDSSGRKAEEMAISESVRASFSWRKHTRRVLWKL
ncbi:osm1 [Symbiodinium necroappetens]|uniref:Osm1 protein n=1 Tax=Symbiodinium necroappetens TaxID=1628268 RepID=A0A812WCB0_9DINO|nr:osm1 [Symbiodinium necroappetens]